MKTLLQLWLLLEWMNSSGVNFSWGKGKKRVDHIEKSICSKCLQTLSLYPIQLGIIFFPLLLRREDAILILCSPLLTEEDRGKKTSFFYSFRALTSSGYYQLDTFFFFPMCWLCAGSLRTLIRYHWKWIWGCRMVQDRDAQWSAELPVPRRVLYWVLLWFSCSAASNSSAAPGTVARQAPLSMGFSRKEYWSGLPFPPPGDLPDLGIKPLPAAWQAVSLPLSYLGSPLLYWVTSTLCSRHWRAVDTFEDR